MLAKINKLIQDRQIFLILIHKSPDGDAVGSACALAELLQTLRKKVHVCCKDDVPYFLTFLKHSSIVKQSLPKDKNFDLIITVDCAEEDRVGLDFRSVYPSVPVLNIDHHISNSNYADYNWVNGEASCVGELVLKIIDSFKVPVSASMAEALYVSVLTDTGSFKYGSTSAYALAMASRLVEAGALPWDISANLYENNPKEKLQLLKEVLGTLKLDEKTGLFASLDVTLEMLDKYGATSEVTDGFVNYARAIKGVEIAILFRELEDRIKLSVRSIGNYNVSDFCALYGGGGHMNAAGCYVLKPLKEAKDIVFDDLRKWLAKK